MEHQPDLIGASIWGDTSVIAALTYIHETTGYPRYRIFIDEIGSRRDGRQYEELTQKITDAWCWGVRLVNIWLWKQTWCGEILSNGNQRQGGLFYQRQPCAGKVIFDGPRPGYWAIRDLIDTPFDRSGCEAYQ
jgi:hypothetical protein